MTTPKPDEDAQRPQSQVDHERAMGEVSDVLLNLEHSAARARKALKAVGKIGAEPNVELALTQTVKDLERVRKRLMQDTYYAGDALRLI